jgi:hypothetical protein
MTITAIGIIVLAGTRVAAKRKRGGGGRHQPAEQAQHRRAALLPNQPQRSIARQSHTGDQHHHPPDLMGVDRSVGAVIAVRQQRQDDQRQHRELQHRQQIVAAHALAEAAQFGFEVQQYRRRNPQHHRQLDFVVPHQHAEAVAQHQRRHCRRPRVAVLLLRRT